VLTQNQRFRRFIETPPKEIAMLITKLRRLAPLSVAALVLLLTACGIRRPPPPPPPPPAPAPLPTPAPPAAPAPAPPVAAPPPAVTPPFPSSNVSHAITARAYRHDAATHLYAANAARIYKGMLQPNLYAIGVLDVDIDRLGNVIAIQWRRAPSHAPEVMAEIVRTVRAAAPFPAPARMGRVTYTDTWLWDKSGKFQLDTLTEGQL